MSNADIKQRLNQLPEGYRKYVLSDMPRIISDTFAEAHQLDEARTLALENGFALYLLFFINQSEFADFIVKECGLEIDTARVLAAGFHTALQPDIQAFHDETSALVFSNPIENVPEVRPLVGDPASMPTAALRTLSRDGQQAGYSSVEEPTYSSMQNAIINESK
jgi:hypothetical protein